MTTLHTDSFIRSSNPSIPSHPTFFLDCVDVTPIVTFMSLSLFLHLLENSNQMCATRFSPSIVESLTAGGLKWRFSENRPDAFRVRVTVLFLRAQGAFQSWAS